MNNKEKPTLTFTAPSEEIIEAANKLGYGLDEKEKRCVRFTGIKYKSIKRGYVQRSKSRTFVIIPRLTLRFSEPMNAPLVNFFKSWIEAAVGKDADVYKQEYNKNLWKQL